MNDFDCFFLLRIPFFQASVKQKQITSDDPIQNFPNAQAEAINTGNVDREAEQRFRPLR